MVWLKKVLIEKNWHRVFEVGIILKGINGVFELAGGSVILFANKQSFLSAFLHFSRGELLEDPNDRVVRFLIMWLQHLSTSAKVFTALYILAHGVLNIFLAIQLYKERLWAYKIAITTMALFMAYQIYRVSIHHSVALIVITMWDAIFIRVLWHEYHYHKKHLIESSV